jgi:hypothetical protein
MISKIHISTPEIMIQKQAGKFADPPVFKENQVVSAKVMSLLSPGKALLLIDGQKVIAKTGLLLNQGEELQLKVVQQKDMVLLKLLEPMQSAGTKQLFPLIRFLSENNALPDIARTKIPDLKNILQETALKSGTRDDSFLLRLIENNGMMWEKKIASLVKVHGQETFKSSLDQFLNQSLKQDLKGVLLNQLFMKMPGSEAQQKMVTGVLDTLENFQLLNTQTSESGRYLLPFPIFAGSDFSFGQLFIDTGDKKEDKNRDSHKMVRISFLLNMTNLGPVRADFSILEKGITGRFLLENDDVRDYVQSMILELESRLKLMEYKVGNIDCKTAAKEEIQPNVLMESLFDNEDDSVLNIVI